jgi:hypothetical protein
MASKRKADNQPDLAPPRKRVRFSRGKNTVGFVARWEEKACARDSEALRECDQCWWVTSMSLDIFKAHSGLSFHPESIKNINFYGPEFVEGRDNGDGYDRIFHRGIDLSAVRCDEHGVRLGQEYIDMLPPPPPEDDSDTDESVQEETEESVREETEVSVRVETEESACEEEEGSMREEAEE